MVYKKQYNQYGQQSFNGPYAQGHYQQPVYNQPPPPKKSGATYTKISKGKFEGFTIVNAWNKSRKGLVTATVAPYHASGDLVTSDKGNEYIKMIASLKYERTGNEKLMPCLMNLKTKVIVLKEISMVITPNGSGRTASGKKATGYFGTMFKK